MVKGEFPKGKLKGLEDIFLGLIPEPWEPDPIAPGLLSALCTTRCAPPPKERWRVYYTPEKVEKYNSTLILLFLLVPNVSRPNKTEEKLI